MIKLHINKIIVGAMLAVALIIPANNVWAETQDIPTADPGAVTNSTNAVTNNTNAVSNNTNAVSSNTNAVSNSTNAVSNNTNAVSSGTNASIIDPNALIIETQLNQFFSQAAFIGNSIGVGLKNYIKKQGPGYLGNPTLLTVGCYSFRNDSAGNPKYMVSLNGTSMKAEDAVALSGARYVFISMGTNDLFEGVDKTYDRYVAYINGIRLKSPGVLFFIESTTPATSTSNVSNAKIDELNERMAKYCEGAADSFYVDISTPMKNEQGFLDSSLSSDNSCHLNNKAYAIWMDTVRNYAYNIILMTNQAQGVGTF